MPKQALFQLPKRIAILLIIIVSISSVSAGIFFLDSQQKSNTIRSQIEDIQNKVKVLGEQSKKLTGLEENVASQSKLIENQTVAISQLNFTVFDQLDILDRQRFELRKRLDTISLLENNVSALKGEVKSKENEIVSLTPTTTNFFVAAVKGEGGGAIIPLEIKLLPKGTGLLSINIKNVELQAGAQDSVRLAASVASQLSKVSLNTVDIDVSFVNQLSGTKVSVDGPSAGGALTATIYAALAKKFLVPGIMMTGTIETDGSIGQVGGVDKKATAARDQGATKFLVPKGQSVAINNLEVVEVGTIKDVLAILIK